MRAYSSDFLRDLASRGYIHQCTDDGALDAAAAKGTISAYIGFDCTAPSLHVGNLIGIMMLRRLQQAGAPSDRPDRGRHDQGRRSVGQGRDAQASRRMTHIRPQYRRHPAASFRKLSGPSATARPTRILVEQCRLARGPQIYRFPARVRPLISPSTACSTFDSVKLRLEREQPLTLSGVQLHDPPGLRLPGAQPAPPAACCKWAAPTSGAISSTESSSPRRVDGRRALRAHDAPADDSHPAPRWARPPRAPSGSNEDMVSPLRLLAVLAEFTEDADVGRFLRLFTEVHDGRDRAISKPSTAPSSTTPRSVLADRGDRAPCPWPRRRRTEAAETARKTFEQGCHSPKACRRVDVPQAPKSRTVSGLLTAFVKTGPGQRATARRGVRSRAAARASTISPGRRRPRQADAAPT